MPEKITAEILLNNMMESLIDNIPKQKPGSFEKDVSEQATSQLNRLFGRQRPLHHVLGGGKPADVLLWRNRKISAGVLASATAIWVLFEWLNYHFFPLLCFALVLCMLVQFIWSIASRATDRPQVPRLELPDKFFVNIATLGGAEINKALRFLQDVACSGNLKQFLVISHRFRKKGSRKDRRKNVSVYGNYWLSIWIRMLLLPGWLCKVVIPEALVPIMLSRDFSFNYFMAVFSYCCANFQVVASLCTAAVIGSWCNFLTLLYIGFVAAHTFPVLYEKYEDQVDSFANNLLRRMRQRGAGKRVLREKKRE